MLPSPVTPYLFLLNLPAWSLFFELAINAVYGARMFNGRSLVWIAPALASIGLVGQAVICGTLDSGAEWGPLSSTLLWGGLRVAYSFPIGLLVYRYREALHAPTLPVWVLAVLLAALLSLNVVAGLPRILFDLTFVLLISPVIVLIGSQCVLRSVSFWAFLGSISYPIYAIHQPIIVVITGLTRVFGVA